MPIIDVFADAAIEECYIYDCAIVTRNDSATSVTHHAARALAHNLGPMLTITTDTTIMIPTSWYLTGTDGCVWDIPIVGSSVVNIFEVNIPPFAIERVVIFDTKYSAASCTPSVADAAPSHPNLALLLYEACEVMELPNPYAGRHLVDTELPVYVGVAQLGSVQRATSAQIGITYYNEYSPIRWSDPTVEYTIEWCQSPPSDRGDARVEARALGLSLEIQTRPTYWRNIFFYDHRYRTRFTGTGTAIEDCSTAGPFWRHTMNITPRLLVGRGGRAMHQDRRGRMFVDQPLLFIPPRSTSGRGDHGRARRAAGLRS